MSTFYKWSNCREKYVIGLLTCLHVLWNGQKKMKKKGGRHWFSFQNFVNYQLDPQVAPKEGASCFASSNSFSKQEHLYSGGPSLPRLLIFKTSAHLNADHQILTFRGLSSNFQSHKVFVGHHGKRYDARCHFSRGHPFWFWTFNSLQICGHFGLKNDCWELSDSELRERRIPLQRYPGDSQKWAKSPKKERGHKVRDGGSYENNW